MLLDPADHARWLHGTIQDVIAFQYHAPFAADRMIIERTEELWRSHGLPASAPHQLAFL
jgi:hypothetical protein